MPSAIVRFRPTGPWRFGPDSGTRDRLDPIYHSDSLYAAVTGAMLRLGLLEEWLDATARRASQPEVRFSSLFPFQRDILFVTPPRSLWPPPPSTKIRFKSARFVPLSVIRALVAEQPVDENRWIIDGESECMIPSGEGPFRIAMRSAIAVDRRNPGAVDPHITACLEFARDAGLWTMVVFSSDETQNRWRNRVKGALRLLADSGFGGERSRGWGRSSEPEWQRCPDFWPAPEAETGHWLLSVYAPAEADAIDWKTGNYATITRTGRIESAARWGALKSPTLMITEGSVLVSPEAPRGGAPNVAPPDFAHPVYRAGFAVTIPIPWKPPGTHAPVFSTQKPVEAAAPHPAPVTTPAAAAPAPDAPLTAPPPEPAVPESDTAAPQAEPVAAEPPTAASPADPGVAEPETAEQPASQPDSTATETQLPEPEPPAVIPQTPPSEDVASEAGPTTSATEQPAETEQPALVSEPDQAPALAPPPEPEPSISLVEPERAVRIEPPASERDAEPEPEQPSGESPSKPSNGGEQ